MNLNQRLIISLLALFFVTPMWAAEPSSRSSLQSSNLLNPNISAIGWFQAEVGHRLDDTADTEAFQLKEVELAFQSMVDAYSKAEFIISVSDEGAEIEEGTLTWFTLPYDMALKIGKFRANFGKFNRTHAAETAFADRPLVEEKYFGEEGLTGTGASLSWHIPNPWLFLNVDAETFTAPSGEDVPGFDKAKKKSLIALGRLSGYMDFTEASNFTFGTSYADGPAGQEINVDNSSTTLKTQFVGVDVTYRWKNPRNRFHALFWQTEALWNTRELTAVDKENSHGLFSHIEFQVARRWKVGGRYDYTQSPTDNNTHEKGGLAYITFLPSEFSLISLQGRHVHHNDGTNENLGFLKTTFNIGPHGAHPF
jgi:hypothetical protein